MAPGDILAGKYRVDRILGAGGMGIVVAATHEALDQKVAIKFLLPTMVDNTDLVRRFLREGRAAGKLKSEHVAKVIDVGSLESGSPFMVLEYLEGRDLSEVLKAEGPLPVSVAVRFILQAVEAIAEAHSMKIIHRDLKPQNLFLTHRVNGDPLVKVLDFGISKAIEEASAEMALTRSQSLLGSPLYMSPEQMRSSRSVDERSDVWSLGVLLHELLTARHPFESDTIPGLVFQVTMEPPTPIRLHRSDVDEGIERIIARCLAKNAAERYANVAELAKDLEPFGGDAVRGLGASIAAVLKPPAGIRSAFASFSDISAVTDNPLAPTLDAKSDPDLARQLEQSASASRARLAAQKPEGSDPAGAASAWGNTQSGMSSAPPRKPTWIYGAAALALVGIGVGATLLVTSRGKAPAGSPVAALSATSTTSASAPAPPAPPAAPAAASMSAASTNAASNAPATSASAPSDAPPSPHASVRATGKAPVKPAPSAPAVAPSQKAPPPKPTPSGPPGFVPYGE